VTAINIAARIWLIAGPTASGKSALALWLAQKLGGEVVNADALQLYRDLRILSARPGRAEEALAPHHLFGVADAADGWSVGRWTRAALPILDDIGRRGRWAILVGGTGLYFRALTQGLAETPAVPDAIAAAVAAELAAVGEAGVRARLAVVDPAAATRILPRDVQRLARALAVADATGRALSDWQAETRPLLPAQAWRAVVLEPPRAALYARCDARLQQMVEAGALDEVRALIARGLDPALPAMKAVGVREFADHLAGRITLPEALALARQATRRYAKRQLTWFRHQTPDWPRITATELSAQQTAFES
jgi:tRNA dimethylallyltransferase